MLGSCKWVRDGEERQVGKIRMFRNGKISSILWTKNIINYGNRKRKRIKGQALSINNFQTREKD